MRLREGEGGGIIAARVAAAGCVRCFEFILIRLSRNWPARPEGFNAFPTPSPRK